MTKPVMLGHYVSGKLTKPDIFDYYVSVKLTNPENVISLCISVGDKP